MKYGTGFAQSVLDEPETLRNMALELEKAGFNFVTSSGHVLGLKEGVVDRPAVTSVGPFLDPFVIFSYLAAITENLRFRTSILILPSLPTALVAKQSAMLAHMSGDRFEMGIGISWNEREYEALGQTFRNRTARMVEQVEVLRRMWNEPLLSFEGKYHKLDQVGINLPKKVNVPILFGAGIDENIMRRVARLGDGWIPLGMALDPLIEAMGKMIRFVNEADRDSKAFSITGRVVAGDDAMLQTAKRLQDAAATHLTIAPPPGGDGDAGLAAIIKAKETLAKELG